MALSTQDFCLFIKEERTKKKNKKSTCHPDSSFPFLWVLNHVLEICLDMLINFQPTWRLLFFSTCKWVPWPLLSPTWLASLWKPPLLLVYSTKGPTSAHPTHCHSQLPRMERHWEVVPKGGSPGWCNNFPLQMFLLTLQSCPSVFPTKSFTPWALKARGARELPAPSPWETQRDPVHHI